MKYKNAQNILPKEIIKIIQQYVDGSYLYIPRKDENRKNWGENSGFKNELIERNIQIYNSFNNGSSVKELANKYYLTENSIRKIIREYKMYYK
ncbi:MULTISPECIES: CD3324 family protein [Clostridium]|uniref:CD3324 family protein n=1 Tax=Clostridium aquiflavi TaxID=3073603 RepID=A0ABU1EIK8_9CLOT|nr:MULTISPECIES: CD3324 family protein [unclassified Clostridium]MDR5588058.1 CD3324 family protein [Clostridium sp. 5N-1]NFG62549.1 DNA-binding response regulator [Clostridium botulinum]NFQ10750.1 DNA-binding response regulator [Clostridium botulinum]